MPAKVYLWLWSVNALITFTLVFWAFGRGIGTTPYSSCISNNKGMKALEKGFLLDINQLTY